MERFVVTLGAKFARELIREFVGMIDILDAALVQESASRAALRCPRYFVTVHDHVCKHRVGKANVGNL